MSKNPLSCDFGAPRKKRQKNITRLYRHKGDFSWKGIKTEEYKTEGKGWADIVRNTLIGNQGESTKFHLRYFEIKPGGFSSFEWHNHEHVVIGLRGRGICMAGKKRYQIGFLDTLYIEPKMPHQLKNPFNEPFGFFCIVNAKRDRPRKASIV
jgi:ribulose-bisphosphate carboxylase large chain